VARRKGEAVRAHVEPLGSISQPQAIVVPGTQACLDCGETALTRIRMTISGGRPAVFVSCPSCEQKGWFAADGDGVPLARDAVMGPGTQA
jgi:hypothetical protein